MNPWQPTDVENLVLHTPSGNYYARFRVMRNGKSTAVMRSLKTDSIKVARRVLPELIVSVRKETPTFKATGPLATFGEALAAVRRNNFTRADRDKPVKPRTLEYYNERAAALIASWPGLAELPVMSLTPAACKNWAASYYNNDARRASAFNGCYLVLKLVVDSVLGSVPPADHPLKDVRRKKLSAKVPAMPTREQFAAMWGFIKARQCHDARDVRLLFALQAFGGLRVSEAAGLRWGDIDFATDTITVACQLSRDGYSLVTPKNGKTHAVQMQPDLRSVLLEAFNTTPAHGKQDRVALVRDCQAALDQACKFAGCQRMTHHALRHWFTTICIESAVDDKTVSSWLGHRDSMLVSKIYGHLRTEHARAMAAKVSSAPVKVENVTPMRDPMRAAAGA